MFLQITNFCEQSSAEHGSVILQLFEEPHFQACIQYDGSAIQILFWFDSIQQV